MGGHRHMACTFRTSVIAIFKGKIVRYISLVHSVRGIVGAVSCFAVLASVSAQNLTNLPGLTELQAPVAKAIQDVCTNFGTSGLNPDKKSPLLAERLFFSCRTMVHTANEIAGVPAGAPGTLLSLGNIGAPRLATGVQDASPVQDNA